MESSNNLRLTIVDRRNIYSNKRISCLWSRNETQKSEHSLQTTGDPFIEPLMLFVCSLSFCRSQSTTCAGFSFSKLGTPKERLCRPSHPLFVSNKNTHQRMPQLFTWLLISSVINRIIWLRLLRPAETRILRSTAQYCNRHHMTVSQPMHVFKKMTVSQRVSPCLAESYSRRSHLAGCHPHTDHLLPGHLFPQGIRTICPYLRNQDAQVSHIEQSDPMLTASRVNSWHQIAVLTTALLLQHEQARPPGNLFSSRGCTSLPCMLYT
jgi:hypothetical protein